MGSNVGTVSIDFIANMAGFVANIDKGTRAVNSSVAQMNKSLYSLQAGFKSVQGMVGGTVAAMAAFAAGNSIVNFGKDAVKAFNEAEQSASRLSAALMSTGRLSDQATQKIVNNATAISRATTVEDDALIEATASFANFAKKLNSSELASAQKAIVGLSTVMKIDLDTAAKQLGKTISGATNTIGRSGIEIGKTKDQSERLAQSLQKLNGFYVTAQNLADTNTGRTEQLKNAWGNLQETFGQTISVGTNTSNLIKTLTDRIIQLDDFIKQHQGTIARLMQITIDGSKVVFYGISSVVNFFATHMANSVSMAIENINRLITYSTSNLNNLIKLVNLVPSALGQKQFGLIPDSTLKNPFAQMKSSFEKNMKNDFALAGKSLNSVFRGRTFNFNAGQGASLGNRDFSDDSSSGNGKGKGSKSHKNHTMEQLKAEAEAIRERNRTIFEIEREGMAKLDKLRKLDLVSMDTYKREKARLNKELMDAIKVPTEDIKAATDNMLAPFRKFLDEMDGSVKTSDQFNDKLSETKNLLDAIKKPADIFVETVRMYDELLKQNFITQTQFNEGLEIAKQKFIEATEPSKEATKRFEDVTSTLANLGRQLEDVFVDAVTQGKFSFLDFAKSAGEALVRLGLQLAVVTPIAEAFQRAMTQRKQSSSSGIIGSLLTSALGGGLSALTGGASALPNLLTSGTSLALPGLTFRAEGGDFIGGRPMIVGERGPELVMPRASGTVIPNDQLGAGSTPNVTVHYHISTGVSQTVKAELASAMPQITRQTVEAVIQASKRGGRMSMAMGARA